MAKPRERLSVTRNESIARVVSPTHRGKAQTRWDIGRNVLHAVNGQIDVLFQKSFFELLNKDALAANLGKRRLLHAVAGGLDDDDLGFHAGRLEDALAHVFRLPFGKETASGSNTNGLHERSRPGRKRSRMASTFWILRRKSFSPCNRRAGSSSSFSNNSSIRASISVRCSGERLGTR